MSPRDCEAYALTIFGVGDVAVCNKASARIIHETISALRSALAAEQAAREKAEGELSVQWSVGYRAGASASENDVDEDRQKLFLALNEMEGRLSEALAKLKEAEEKIERAGNLIARVCGDGGHKINELGWDGACDFGEAHYLEWCGRADRAEFALKEAEARVGELEKALGKLYRHAKKLDETCPAPFVECDCTQVLHDAAAALKKPSGGKE